MNLGREQEIKHRKKFLFCAGECNHEWKIAMQHKQLHDCNEDLLFNWTSSKSNHVPTINVHSWVCMVQCQDHKRKYEAEFDKSGLKQASVRKVKEPDIILSCVHQTREVKDKDWHWPVPQHQINTKCFLIKMIMYFLSGCVNTVCYYISIHNYFTVE